MSYEPKYIPYRINMTFEVQGTDVFLKENCRSASEIVKRKKARYAIYKRMDVVNVPTEFELAHFEAGKFAILIPQDNHGIDIRTSGVARSPRTSRKAFENAIHEIVAIKNDLMVEERAKSKATPKPDPIPRLDPESESVKKVDTPEEGNKDEEVKPLVMIPDEEPEFSRDPNAGTRPRMVGRSKSEQSKNKTSKNKNKPTSDDSVGRKS